MSFAAAITIILDLPEARNHTEAELYGKYAADRIRESFDEPLRDCKLEEVIDYEVDE